MSAVHAGTFITVLENIRQQIRAYFSVQYCTLCAVLMEKCAVLNAKMCSIECKSVHY